MDTLLDLTGRTALVTGASGDIGSAIARMLASHGAAVGVHCLSSVEQAESLAAEIASAGGKAMALRADVGRAEEVAAMVDKLASRFGPVDVLVNNAGVRRRTGDHKYILEVTEEEWGRELESHLDGMFLCCKACVPHMIEAGAGRIVNVSSVVGRSGLVGASVQYASAKAGMFGFTKALANQMSSKNITVNCIAPGLIDTVRIRWRTPEQMREHVAKIPLGRLGTVDEVAGAVLYLVSPIGGYVTGATLDINGGLYMG